MGARSFFTRSATASNSGTSRYSKSSGTGRTSDLTTAVGFPVRCVRYFSNCSVGPKVALMSRNVARDSVSSGTCQATPRSRSE